MPVIRNKSGIGWAVALGCGGLLLLGVCAGSGIVAWSMLRKAGESGSLFAPPSAQPVLPATPTQGPAPVLPPPRGPAGPVAPAGTRLVTATVVSVQGGVQVHAGAECSFTVEKHDRPEGYWCRAQVVCGGQLVYGGPEAGYFPCHWRMDQSLGIGGRDDQTTAGDGDPALEIDTTTGRLTIRDDARGPRGPFLLEARIANVR